MNGPVPITVLLPVYNSANFLAATIQSILDQSFPDFELLIIDDLSTDGCPEVIRSFSDPRIKMIFHQKNLGLNATLNEGIELAKGEYIARMDGDDLMHPERLEIQKRYLDEHPEVAVVASTVELINTEDEITGAWDTDRACITPEQIRAMMPRTNCIAHPSVMIRRSALGSTRYSMHQKNAEDWDLWLRLLSQGKIIAKIERPLLQYRVHPSSMMGITKRKVPLEKRLMLARKRFVLGEWREAKLSPFHAAVAHAQARTFARHMLNTGREGLRDLKRSLTYSPLETAREERALHEALARWNGRQLLLFPHMRMGGAEQVHAQIAAAIADQDPLIIIHGFSEDRSLADRFTKAGQVLELPRLLNHPSRKFNALQHIADKLNSIPAATVLGGLSGTFHDLLPFLNADVRAVYLQHAFLHQPTGNVKHKEWLTHFGRVDNYVFVARHALAEFEKFLFANNIPRSSFSKLRFISNAVEHFGPPEVHELPGVLFVGRDSSEKRVDLFIKIAEQLEARAPGAFQFSMAGPKSGLAHIPVRALGTITDPKRMQQIYAAHDLLVVTSTREGFPLVIMEAMAMGLAVVSTPVGDIPNRLSEDEAIITTTADADPVVEQMTDALLALTKDRNRLEGMRQAAYARALKEFAPELFERAYRELLIRPAATT